MLAPFLSLEGDSNEATEAGVWSVCGIVEDLEVHRVQKIHMPSCDRGGVNHGKIQAKETRCKVHCILLRDWRVFSCQTCSSDTDRARDNED